MRPWMGSLWQTASVPERRRNLWPLPGGVARYLPTLRSLVAAVDQGADRTQLEVLVAELAPSVGSSSTVRGYAAVPVTLGLVDRSVSRTLRVTQAGRRFARSGDPAVVRSALVEHVLGAEELLVELLDGPSTCLELTAKLEQRGIAWNHSMAVRYRVWWLVASEAVSSTRDSRVDRLALTPAGKRLAAAGSH